MVMLGIDFDNTLVSYEEIFCALVSEMGLPLKNEEIQTKQQIRDAVRRLGVNGDLHWQKMQALAYGERILEAPAAEGVIPFLEQCKEYSIPLCIISHKTETAFWGDKRFMLREAAMQWLEKNRICEAGGIAKQNIFFEPTRREKVLRIGRLQCSYFIDDLEETFLEEIFPHNTQKILYSASPSLSANALTFAHWREIQTYLRFLCIEKSTLC